MEIELTVLAYGDTYNNKVNTMLAAGDPIDICFTAGWGGGHQIELGQTAISLNWTIISQKTRQSPMWWAKTFMNGHQNRAGRLSRCPATRNRSITGASCSRKDLVDKYQVDLASIKKMADLEPYYDKIKAGEPGVTPLLTVLNRKPPSSSLTGTP